MQNVMQFPEVEQQPMKSSTSAERLLAWPVKKLLAIPGGVSDFETI